MERITDGAIREATYIPVDLVEDHEYMEHQACSNPNLWLDMIEENQPFLLQWILANASHLKEIYIHSLSIGLNLFLYHSYRSGHAFHSSKLQRFQIPKHVNSIKL